MSGDRSPALIISFSEGTTAAARDRLVALLADHDLLAIQEDDIAAPRHWTAHFADASSRDAAAAALAALPDGEPLGLQPVDVDDEDWARRTQADLPAIRVGRVIVAPPWDLPDPVALAADCGWPVPNPESIIASPEFATPGFEFLVSSTDVGAEGPAIVVEIEPSRGFGTGHHQSTRLCLVLLQDRDLSGRTVLDVGTGSGVLAIAAAKLGAAFVSAIDVDPDAVENARENIARNGVERTVEAHVRDLTDPALPVADLVTANLTGTLLARHAAALGAVVRPAGSLLVAGFTVDEKPLVTEAFTPAFQVTESAEEDDWWAFVLTRAGS